MGRVSITLPESLDCELSREARRTRRPRSAVVQEAIAEYLARREQEQFRAEVARAAADPDDHAVALADEALPLDNEALRLSFSEILAEWSSPADEAAFRDLDAVRHRPGRQP